MTIYSRIGEWIESGARSGKRRVRVLIVDDSVVMRSFLERLLGDHPEIEVAGTLASATRAFDFLNREQVDIVLLDHEMPDQNGLEVLPRMIDAARGAHVVMLSSHCQQGSKIAVTALSMGASYALAKPSRTQPVPVFSKTLIDLFLRLGTPRGQTPATRGRYSLRPFPHDFRLGCIGIGASTGGIPTLGALFSGLREKPGAPILITQHLPETFIPYYARQVARMTDLPVSVALAGQAIEPDHVYIAPGEASLSCRRDGATVRVALIEERDPVTRSRPSVNLMFAGIADCFGAGALGVVLTGIGRDGTAGATRIAAAGGAIIAQDAQSSTIWGMPGSVTRAGLASANLPPQEMTGYICRQTGRG